ncbi:hypothetical protein OAJ33_03385 [Acidimicrobiaceae bacterium]|nr:hypothetical protein [Acidimicrobiaceae bacterium]
MQLYRDRKKQLRPFLSGLTLSYIGLDNITSGPFREYLSQYFDLQEFGSNAREEYLYYTILFIGILQLVVTVQSIFLPVIEIIDSKIVLRTKEKTLSVVKDISEISNIEMKEDNFLQFTFSDKTYNVQIAEVAVAEIDMLMSSVITLEEE